jgi:AraC-like DNA-binding protein
LNRNGQVRVDTLSDVDHHVDSTRVNKPSTGEWAECPPGRDGVELLQASFTHHVYDRHMHDAYAIGVTLRGVQRFWCSGAHHDSMPGNVIVIRPGEVHDGRSGSHGGYAYRMIYVRPDLVDSLVDDAPSPLHGALSGPLVADRVAFDYLNAGWKALAASPHSLASDELLLRGLCALAKCADSGRSAGDHDPALKRVRDYLHHCLERSVTMRELSALASMSRFQLSRRFQECYGVPVHGYLRHLRLEEAKRRLARGQEIAIVAADLGFVDQSHFHRRFRGSFGMTPGRWRAAHRYKTTQRPAIYRDPDDHDRTSRRRSKAL